MAVAGDLPDPLAATVLDVARDAFLAGVHLTSAIAAVLAVAVAALALVLLRHQDVPAPDAAMEVAR